MSLYRNRYFLSGMLLILLGVQFRMVQSFVLNENTTRVLAKITKDDSYASQASVSDFMMQMYPRPTKRITPPRWFGLSLITIGAIISCHALVIPKHNG